MPDMTPVATQIQPPNTINAFANVVNLQRNIAETQQAQQQNQELTALHQFTTQAMNDPQYHNDDGSLNIQKFQNDAMKVAPVYGQAYIGQATQNANEGISNRQALLQLGGEQRKVIGGYFASVAADPNATYGTLLDAVEQAREANKDPMFQRSLDSMLLHAPPTHGMNAAQENQAIRQYARNAAIAVGAPEAQQSAPQIGTMQGPRGMQTIQTNPQSPLGIGPQGAPMPQGISPQVINQPGTGAPNIVGPNGQARPINGAPSPQSGGTNWWNPAPGQLNFLTAQTQGVAQRAQAGISAAQTSPQAIDALTRIDAILEKGTWTGTAFSGFKDLKNLAASLGIDTSTAQNASELAKNIARYEAARAGAVGDTDAARSLVEAGSPNYKMDAQAVKSVTDQSLAIERIIMGYGKLMETSPDPQTAMQRETAFRSIPNLVQAYEAGQMKNKADMDEFLKRYNISAADLAKSRQQLRDMGAL